MNKVILIQNGEALNSPVSFNPDPQSETGPVEGHVSITEGTKKATIDVSIVAQYRPTAKAFSTLQAQAARVGHELTESRHETGLMLWQVARWGQTRQFNEWSEACCFVAPIGGCHV